MPAFADQAIVGPSWYFLEFSGKSPRLAYSRRLHDCHSRHLVFSLSARRVSCALNHTASHYTSQGCRPTPAARAARVFDPLRFVLPPILLLDQCDRSAAGRGVRFGTASSKSCGHASRDGAGQEAGRRVCKVKNGALASSLKRLIPRPNRPNSKWGRAMLTSW